MDLGRPVARHLVLRPHEVDEMDEVDEDSGEPVRAAEHSGVASRDVQSSPHEAAAGPPR